MRRGVFCLLYPQKKKTALTRSFCSAEGEIWTPDQGLMSPLVTDSRKLGSGIGTRDELQSEKYFEWITFITATVTKIATVAVNKLIALASCFVSA